jgi:uncharacterized protein YgiB involved in biofilm formation
MGQQLKASFLMSPIALGVSMALLSGCSDQEEAIMVDSVADCTSKTSLTQQQCEAAYQSAETEAARTGPKYATQAMCAAEFGYQQCHQNSSGFFTPFMTGFLVSQVMNSSSYFAPVYRYNRPYSNYHNKIMTADGYVLGDSSSGRYKVSSAQMKPKPTVTKTVSRGGFGSTASAKSSWGGGSKSGSWGG